MAESAGARREGRSRAGVDADARELADDPFKMAASNTCVAGTIIEGGQDVRRASKSRVSGDVGATHYLSRRVFIHRAATAGASAGALALLAACGSSAVEVSEQPTVTMVPVEGAPTERPSDVVPGSSPASGGEEVAEAPSGGDAGAAGGGESGGETVELEAYDIGWTQEELTVPVGGTINMHNSGVTEHNFAIEGYNDDSPVDLPPGGEVVAWAVPADLAPGAYVFYCEVPGHRQAGMEGVLTITEGGGQVAASENSPAADQAVAGADTVKLEAYDIGWTQTELTVPAGGTIEMTNSGVTEHNFAVEGYNDDSPVDLPVGGEAVEWAIPADLTPGDYVFYCEVPGHRQAGMEGTLTIVEAGPSVAAGGGESGGESSPAAERGADVAAASPAGDTPAAGVGETVELEAYDIGWTQKELTVPVGGTIDMYNSGVTEHNFAVEGYNDDSPVDLPVDGEVVEWKVPDDLEPGQYVYYCEIPGHRQAGMEGVLTVTPAGTETAGTGNSPAAADQAAGGSPPPADQAVQGASTVKLEAYDIGWTQKEITVPAGGTIQMTNVGVTEHNFAIDGYKNDEVLVDLPAGGDPVDWPVPADLAPGTYTYYCEIPGHRAAGMEGTLTVV